MMLKLEEIEALDFWKGFDQDFHIEQLDASSSLELEPDLAQESRDVLNKEGYYHYQKTQLQLDHARACKLIKDLVMMKLPPIFALVYDEFWQLQNQLASIVNNALGADAKLIPAMWAWCVETNADNVERHEKNHEYNRPVSKQSFDVQVAQKKVATAQKVRVAFGDNSDFQNKYHRSIYSSFIEPHRDKGKIALKPDGSATSITTWIPLNESNPLNSCIHLVPADKDRNYNTDLQDNWNFNFADIRALPAKPGDILIWNQAVLHWGSMPAARDGLEPRISIGFDYVEAGSEHKLQYPIDFMPSFEERRQIIAMQIVQYIHKMETNEGIVEFVKKYR